MECPVCGAKMIDGKLCKYCGVTDVQVKTASNQKAKQAIKSGNKKDVCYSRTMPSDVNKLTLTLLTVFLGYAGAGNFYVGKRVKAWMNVLSCAISLVLATLIYIGEKSGWGNIQIVLNTFLNIISMFVAISLVMWFSDIVALIFKRYKVPVILGEDEVKQKVRATRRKV